MTERSDAQLLQDYARGGKEAAFREIVTRYTDLVYSAAVRQVESADLAADIAQSVFVDLARKAKQLSGRFSAQSSLAGWLHRSTRYAALNHLRDTHRRLKNERQAMEQLLTNSESPADWEQIRPVLDEALDSLDDEDREAVLLRYFKNQDFRAVGLVLGVSDDAAQKRVSRAVERLREFFTKRNVTIGAGGLVVLISANAVQAAPVGLALTISAAALAGTAVSTATVVATTTKAVAMTALQKSLVAATVAVLAGAGIYQAKQAHDARAEVQTLRQGRTPLAEQIQRLQSERDDATNQLAGLLAENSRLKSNSHQNELLRLRGEVGVLRKQLQDAKQALARVAQTPKANEIPADAAEQQKRMQIGKMIDGKNLVAQLFTFAEKNQGWLPTNWLQVAEFEKDYPVSGTNDFEFVHKQPINLRALGTNMSNTAVVREYMAWPTCDGKWRKVYGFADGHSQVIEVPDGNFTAWEEQNTYNPEAVAK